MSASIHTVAIGVLAPLVGEAMATVYVAKAAQSHGKDMQSLTPADSEWFFAEIRHEISPFATRSLIDDAIAQISERTRA